MKKYKLVFKFILIIPSLHFEWPRLHVTIKQIRKLKKGHVGGSGPKNGGSVSMAPQRLSVRF